jgi:hypothetical protein
MRYLICALIFLFSENILFANRTVDQLPIPDRFEKNGVSIKFLPEIDRRREMPFRGIWSPQDRALFGFAPMTEAGGRLKSYLTVLEGLRPLILSKKHHFKRLVIEESGQIYLLKGETLGVGNKVSAKNLEKYLQKMK